jgi:subfamily B ATP-binding cassette protein MsbA
LRTYLRLLRFALPYRFRILGAVACMSVLSATTALYAWLLGPVLKFLFTGDPKATLELAKLAPGSMDLGARLAGLDRSQLLAWLPVVIVGVSALKGVAYFGQFFLMGMAGQRIMADIRRTLFAHLLAMSPGFYARRHSGDLLVRFNTDVGAVDMALTNAIPSYLRDGLTVIVMLVSCFVLDWRMSLVAFGAVPLTLLPVIRLTKRLRKVTGKAQATWGNQGEVLAEALGGMRVVQAYGMERWESSRYEQASQQLVRFMRKSLLIRAFSSPLMEVMGAAGLAAAVWWVGGQIMAGRIEPAKFFSFVTAIFLLYQPVKGLGRVSQSVIQGAAAGDRVFEILDTPTPVPDVGKGELPAFREAVRYQGVSFAYGERPVLTDFSLEIRRGEVIALVGGSGGGKTTVANLLPRFWDPQAGRITIDGRDIREVTLRSLRAQLAIVTQENVLFNDTIRNNIAYGRPDIPHAEVERAARLAQAHEFILAKPEGYETRVGERGVNLSGGQRQRLAIARAFLKDAPILILDEATSALDAESEREVQRALDSLMGLEEGNRRTTLVIAHRLSTIRNADRIVVISGGRVVEAGTHDELVARGGEYARLHSISEGEKPLEARAAM